MGLLREVGMRLCVAGQTMWILFAKQTKTRVEEQAELT